MTATPLSHAQRATRGHGRLENWLAGRRAAMARRLLRNVPQESTLLDVGCGSFPVFLQSVRFRRRIGLDQVIRTDLATQLAGDGIELMTFQARNNQAIPLEDASVDAVTMLAVFEHIPRQDLLLLLNDIARVLCPGGLWVMTTPSGWTGPILAAMSALHLVSGDEIDEHQDSYSRAKIRAILRQSAMSGWPTEFGSFEWGMNTWVRLRKPL